MAEYIERAAVRDRACAGCVWRTIHEDGSQGCSKTEPCEDLIAEFICAPAADVAPVVHSKWDTAVFQRSDCELVSYTHICPECKFLYRDLRFDGYDHCPNCGARMDGK